MKKKTSYFVIGGLLIIILIESAMLISSKKGDKQLGQESSTPIEASSSEESPQESQVMESEEVTPGEENPYILPPKAMVDSISIQDLRFDMEGKKLLVTLEVHPLPGMEGLLTSPLVSSKCKAQFRGQLFFKNNEEPEYLQPEPLEEEVDLSVIRPIELSFSFENVHFPADLYTMEATNQNLSSVTIYAKFPGDGFEQDAEFAHSVVNPELKDPQQDVWVHEGKLGNEIQE
ncbi:MAG: hypothetical protein PT957_01765 [Firmicutes bacterium]|nr:hypothetical protein [Bacillota bacterium]